MCPQEDQCEKGCILAKKQESVAIGRLERFVADFDRENNITELPRKERFNGKKIAVVGSGPSGLTVTGDLLMRGYDVTLFEAFHKPGGVLMYGIPEFRLPKAIVEKEVEYLVRLGCELRLNQIVGKSITLDELLKEQGFDAVFVGVGAGLPAFLNVPGEDLGGIYSANEYLTRNNLMKAYKFPEYDTPAIRARRVVTVGGGNVAMDSARTALRLGAESSTIVYRRSRAEMPARAEEIHHAEQEGVNFELLANPIAIHSTDNSGWVREVECIRMELGEPDASGRRRPVPKPGSNFRVPADVVVISVGQSPNPLVPNTTPGLNVAKGGIIVTDAETGKTSKRGVFAGGDVATGGATVILAMGAGKKAAKAIDEFLKTGAW